MHVHIEQHHDLAVLRPEGRFFGGDETVELEHRLGDVLDSSSGIRGVVVDLGRTLYLNSTAIGVLVHAHERAKAHAIELRLCNADHSIHSALVILKLANVMALDQDVERTLALLGARAGSPASEPQPQPLRATG